MSDPDWGRVLVNTAHKTMPVGDPRIWGGTVTSLIDVDPALPPRFVASDQVVLAQATDRYSRSWSINGSLKLPNTAVADPSLGATPPSYVETNPATLGTPPLAVWLSVTMGVERISFEHNILLWCGTLAQNFGLCANQNSQNGGPYGALIPNPAIANDVLFPFACIGALIGQSIQVRVYYVRGIAGGPLPCPQATISAMVTPYAPGHGI